MPQNNTKGWNSHDNDFDHFDETTGTHTMRSGNIVQISSPFVTITRNEQGILFEPAQGLFGTLLPKPGKDQDGSSFHPHSKKKG